MESLSPVKEGFDLTLTKWWPWWFSSYKMSSPLIVPWPLALTSLLALTGDWQLFERNCRSLSWPNKVRCEVLFYLDDSASCSLSLNKNKILKHLALCLSVFVSYKQNNWFYGYCNPLLKKAYNYIFNLV